MARWYIRRGGRFYRRGRVGYGGRYRRYRRRSYARRYVNGSSKSNVRMKTAVEASGTVQIPDADTMSGVVTIPVFGSGSSTYTNNRSVLASPLYQTYCSLYEEVKCVGMKVNLSVATPIGGTSLPSLQIYTAWDRRHGRGEADYSAADIKASSTYNVATALNNNVAKLTRSLYASDLMEKAQWHDCTLATPQGSWIRDEAYTAAGVNPNFFCPALFISMASPSLAAAASPATVNIQLSIVYYMAFRNPKYGASSAGAKLVSLGERFGDLDGDDGDMDEPPAASAAGAEEMDVSETQPLMDATTLARSLSVARSDANRDEHRRQRTIVATRIPERKN